MVWNQSFMLWIGTRREKISWLVQHGLEALALAAQRL
jgi:hypothetical protein